MKSTQTVVLSSGNPAKLQQLRRVFKGSPFTVKSPAEENIQGEYEEVGTSASEIAHKKALFVSGMSDHRKIIVADHTSIIIPNLGGEPGVNAATWANSADEIITKLQGETRFATFATFGAVVLPDEGKIPGVHTGFSAEMKGLLLLDARGNLVEGQYFDQLFVPEGCQKTLAEMTEEEYDDVSSRAVAYRRILEFLQSYYR